MATDLLHSARQHTYTLLLLSVALAGLAGGVARLDEGPGSAVVPVLTGAGNAPRVPSSTRPSVEAGFLRESYRRGQTARLAVYGRATGLTLQIFRAGTESVQIRPRDEMRGSPVTAESAIGNVVGRRVITVGIGDWPSGLYYARLTAAGGRIGHAPFVLRPTRLGENPVAVVLPTFTWQAYNYRDDDRDGDEDTWYADPSERFARLGRPYENRGVPRHYKHYDQPFLRWLVNTGREVDYLADSDLHRMGSGAALAGAYELIVFPGHHEYVTKREFDAVQGFRDRGGNLMFLSANNFFWRVDLRANAIWRIRKWRDLGRPEAALIGVQYIGNDNGQHRGSWILTRRGAASWIFAGVGVPAGSGFSNGGIEIDKINSSTPRGTIVLAEIRNLLGPGMTGQMTYYRTRAGAKVFAAGAFTLAGSVWQPAVRRVMENLWGRLASTSDPGGRPPETNRPE